MINGEVQNRIATYRRLKFQMSFRINRRMYIACGISHRLTEHRNDIPDVYIQSLYA